MNNFPILTSDTVKKTARCFGADLVGIGAIDRWKGISESESPKEIMPHAKSVICIGFRIHRGALRGAEEGTYFSAYSLSSFEDVNRIIAPLYSEKCATLLKITAMKQFPSCIMARTWLQTQEKQSKDRTAR